MLNIWETFDTNASIKNFARTGITGKFESENILQHLESEQACIDLIQSICQHLRKRWEYRIVQNLQIGLSVWSWYFQALRATPNREIIITLPDIQIPYSDTIQTAISYINTLQIEDGEAIKQEIFAIISQS